MLVRTSSPARSGPHEGPETAHLPVCPRRGRTRVPREVVAACGTNETALAIAAVLYDRQAGRSGVVRLPQARIMALIGRPGRDATTVRRHVRFLDRAGLLDVRRMGLGRYRYQLRVLAGGDVRWDEIPHPLMDALADGEITPAVLPVWFAVNRALGVHGRTHDTDTELAERYGLGLSARTVRRHLSRLVSLGYVQVRRCGDGSRMLHRPGLLTDDPADKSAASGWTEVPPVGGASLAPEKELAPENAPSSALADARHPGDEPVSDDAAAKNDVPSPQHTTTPRRQSSRPAGRDPVIAWVLGGMPEEYRTGLHRRWTRGVAAAIRSATGPRSQHQRLTPSAARFALTHLLDVDAHGGRTVPAARQALRLLAHETRAGLACRDCGHDDRPIERGLCIVCTPEHALRPEELTAIPADERRALYASLGLDPDEAGPPEAQASTEEALR